jgi:hypothetical protein
MSTRWISPANGQFAMDDRSCDDQATDRQDRGNDSIADNGHIPPLDGDMNEREAGPNIEIRNVEPATS